ncbi:MAG TPA: DUF4382 domain-containing protein [Gemmatimonadales bacterium]|nr:DUF4382 domain-containing protein [Gemmatimonadales bacterium]
MLRTRLRTLAATLAMALTAAGCAVQPSAAGSMTMMLTDAPGSLKRAVVTISKIYLQGSAEDSIGGRVVLRDSAFTTDLLTLADSTTALLQNVIVPGGDYAEIRFVISGAYIEVDNGNGTTSIYASSPDYPGLPSGATVAGVLQMPSYSTSGLKVDLSGGALHIDGGQQVILVDFNVAQSFGHGAGTARWVMSPVIKAGELQATGEADVVVSLGTGITLPVVNARQMTLADVSVTVNGETTFLSDPDSDGVYTAAFRYLLPGTYAVTLADTNGVTFTTAPASPIPVSLASGSTSTVTTTIVSVP